MQSVTEHLSPLTVVRNSALLRQSAAVAPKKKGAPIAQHATSVTAVCRLMYRKSSFDQELKILSAIDSFLS